MRNQLTKLQNTFKPLVIAHKKKEVMISDREMAIYNYVKLKLAYQHDQAQGVYDAILRQEKQKLARLQRITTGSILGVMFLAVVGLILSRII